MALFEPHDSTEGDAATRALSVTAVENHFVERVYEGLRSVIGRRRISRFIESLVRPYVVGKDLEVAYRQMAREEAREAEALAWAEATVGDVADEAR